MGVMERISQLMASDIDHLLEQAGDPEGTIEELIGELEESIVDLRREMVTAVTRKNRVRKQLFAAEEAAVRVEREATLALACGDELKARHTLSRAIHKLKTRDALEVELAIAGRASGRMVAALIRMEDRVQLARRKQDELARRRRASSGRQPAARRGADETMSAVRRRLTVPTVGASFDGYTEAVGALEHEAARAAEDELEGGGPC